MSKPTIYFLTPDLPQVSGGIKQVYRHVDILNAAGYDATVVHKEEGFKPKWFEHRTRIIYASAVNVRDDDVGVFREIWGPMINNWKKPTRKVIFNQNACYTSIG